MWFIFALITALAWGGADLFYKKGSDKKERHSAIRIVIAVGVIMGIQAFYMLLFVENDFKVSDIITYFPVSFFYILSMFFGYIGLRYIELSISSPIQNSSGALTSILLVVFFAASLNGLAVFAIALITTGVVLLAVFEPKDRIATSENKKYRIGILAITFPILYMIIDALGTFADAVYLDELQILSSEAALISYELTFLICAIIGFIYLKFIKKENFFIKAEKDRYFAAVLETAGQYFYVYAMADNSVITAPLIASYSVFSVILSRIFLKEKLSKKQYIVVAVVLVGIAVLGFAEEI